MATAASLPSRDSRRSACKHREILLRPSDAIETRWLLILVGTIVTMVVAERLARAFPVVGAARLIRYRSDIDHLKDAGVLLVALALLLCPGGDERDRAW